MHAGGIVSLAIVSMVVLATLAAADIKLLAACRAGGTQPFAASKHWCSNYLACELCWTYRAATSSEQKLPANYQFLGMDLQHRLTIFFNAHNIHPSLVVDIDQTASYFIPARGSHTFAPVGVQSVSIAGANEMRACTVVMGSAASGA